MDTFLDIYQGCRPILLLPSWFHPVTLGSKRTRVSAIGIV